MKAIVWHAPGDIRLDDVAEPAIEEPTDAIVKITRTAICGTDLHAVRGSLPGMREGTVLGHEAVGTVEELGSAVRGFRRGDRVVICSTVSCGSCSYCRAGHTAQCDNANPHGPGAGTCFFGGPEPTGPVNGLQAEYARIPWASSTMVRVPDALGDDAALMVSDVLPTGWFGARIAQVSAGDTVAVLGAGIVGQCAIASAKRQGARRVIAVDSVRSRLDVAQSQNAEIVDFTQEDPVTAVHQLTLGIGVDRVIDAVGVDAFRPRSGPAADALPASPETFDAEQAVSAPDASPDGGQWQPGDAPSLALRWAAKMTAKAGSIGIAGVYPQGFDRCPVGVIQQRNLTVQGGNCNHSRHVPHLLEMVTRGTIDPTAFITRRTQPADAIEAYRAFDLREDGWLKTTVPMG
ncbi:alcohol dehydrogenase catalytic domain-containing protein [Tomitella gaofuii]|uniref:alcohol dehydrogenase catalytic domain-containing protein n=1 Tax=Tomitella gaofuii TaxID=2760083 RepID=UPI0015FB1D16|nr:alcohol dehydrogenase catalytic domain-containing protein [Tomitella gaofuii]